MRAALWSGSEARLATLGFDFQEGFDDDTVAVYVDGERVFRRAHVTTQRLLGLAHSFHLERAEGPVMLLVLVETRRLIWSARMRVAADVYLGISVVDGQLDVFRADKGFGYA